MQSFESANKKLRKDLEAEQDKFKKAGRLANGDDSEDGNYRWFVAYRDTSKRFDLDRRYTYWIDKKSLFI